MADPGAANDRAQSPPSWNIPVRECRYCGDEVKGAVMAKSQVNPFAMQKWQLQYTDDDPQKGKLLRPCKCKGTMRYVHEGCLNAWASSDSSRSSACPTCKVKYNRTETRGSKILTSWWLKLSVTFVILWFAMFLLGFIADPIINLYVDGASTIFEQARAPTTYSRKRGVFKKVTVNEYGEIGSWTQHFMKGLASLGVLSFARVMILANPWNYWNLRNAGLVTGSARPGTTGQDRVINISWIALAIGLGTALYFIFKQTQEISKYVLARVGYHILDMPLPEDAEEDYVPMDYAAAAPPPSEMDPSNAKSSPHTSEPEITDHPGHRKSSDDNVKTSAADLESSAQLHSESEYYSQLPGGFHEPSWSFSNIDQQADMKKYQ